MRHSFLLPAACAALIALNVAVGAPDAFAKDHGADYQMGTFVSSTVAADGTITNTLHGDGTTTAGSVFANQIAIYTVRVADGVWTLNTYTQNKDSMIRSFGMTPMHFKAEKDNPLDVLKGGERVLFRVERHRLLNGIETSIFIPYADNPDKEFHFIGYFAPTASSAAQRAKPSDNVKAMCEAHKLSPELEKEYCEPAENSQPEPEAAAKPAGAQPAAPTSETSSASSIYSDLDNKTVENLNRLTCDQIKVSLLSNPQVVENLVKYLPQSLASIRVRCPAEAAGLK